jgi:PAS domain S-box-containing protein
MFSFPDEDAPYRYTVTSMIDITPRKLTERALSESEKRFRVMADTAPVFIWTTGADKGFYYFNNPWLDFRGKSIEDEIGSNWMKGIHPVDLPLFQKTFESSFGAQAEFSIEYRVKRFDGEYRWILNHSVPRYSLDGTFQGYIGTGMDITARKKNEVELSRALTRERKASFQAEQVQIKLEFLAEASNILSSSLNYTETIRSLAELLTPAICDWFAVDLLSAEGLQQLVVYHKDPSKRNYAIELQKKFPRNANASTGVSNVIRTGNPVLHKKLSDEFLRSVIKDDELFDAVKEMGIKSVIIIPLTVRSKVLGAVTLCTAESEKTYDEADLRFAEDIAHRAAIAIENATLFRKIEELNRSLEHTIKQQQQEIIIRRQVEKELRESEERFRLITENSNDFISLFDENDNFLYANPAIINVLGYNENELVGKVNFNDLIYPGDKELTKSYGTHSVIELRYRKKDGAYIWVESSSLQVNYHGKKITIRISRDITERKRIENERTRLYAQIETQKIRIDNLLANVPGVVWETRGKPFGPDQKMEFVSEYVEKLLGYSVKEWLNTPNFWSKIIHPDDREEAISEAMNNYVNKKRGINRFRWIKKDGSEVWIEAQSTCICGSDGNVIGMRGVNMDVTEQIKFEKQISASLKEKEVLLKEIHHRVKNNMQVISSLLSLQSKCIPDKHVQEIFDESRNRIRSMALIHEKLYQTRNLFEIDFHSYVEDLINNLMISYGVNKQNIIVKINIEHIRFDIDNAITLGLIINELASNSFRHAFKLHRKGVFEVSVDKRNDNFKLMVKDNGAGIPDDLDAKKNESLGLQLVETLIEQLYGKYEIHSNGGTEVLIEFPDPAVKEVNLEAE